MADGTARREKALDDPPPRLLGPPPLLPRGAGRTLLAVEGLTRRFPGAGLSAVNGVSLSLREGELLALVGPSGCGKTTTLRMIGGFEPPDSGRVVFDGRDVTADPPERRGFGFVFQDYALFPHLSVLDNVRFGLRGLSRAAGRARAAEMLALVGLSDHGKRMPHALSGGQQQRVALARTLATEPRLVLLDEPFSNLDAARRVETRQEVRSLLRQAGSAAILVTHDQEEALALADRVAVMEAGRLAQIGAPDTVYRNPCDCFVASFLSRATILPGEARGRVVETPIGALALAQPAFGPIRVAIRPEQIALALDGHGSGRILAREYRGHDQFYQVRLRDRTVGVISAEPEPLPVGVRVSIAVRGAVSRVADDR
ncbi:MAG: ABC transporter ATP-binding protein [Rhodobacteraceae bacterium]|nr:MAG: ABC transporter ATP-binding protein [Paracoccaceae bacterium]